MERQDLYIAAITIPVLTILFLPTILGILPGYGLGISPGNSMQPAGSNPSIYIMDKNPENITEGDIIGGDGVLHRVIDKNQTHIIRKGDNNKYRDPPITYEEVEYKAHYLPTPWKHSETLANYVESKR